MIRKRDRVRPLTKRAFWIVLMNSFSINEHFKYLRRKKRMKKEKNESILHLCRVTTILLCVCMMIGLFGGCANPFSQ